MNQEENRVQILFDGKPDADIRSELKHAGFRWAPSQGIISGYGNGMFGPDDPITREQLAVMLWRYSGSPAATNKELHFTDTDEISGFALEALRWAVENGIIVGFGDMDHTGYLDRLYVHKDYQNQGIATAICEALERNAGSGSLRVHASVTAKPFFLLRGYEVVREQQVMRQGIALTNYVMEKSIFN